MGFPGCETRPPVVKVEESYFDQLKADEHTINALMDLLEVDRRSVLRTVARLIAKAETNG